jgi:hypothetical protein
MQKDNSKAEISNKLHEDLADKHQIDFWKTWKHKVCGETKNKVTLKGNPPPQIAINDFAQYFSGVSSPNNPELDKIKRELYNEKIASYIGKECYQKFSAEIVAIALDKIEKGKSPGFDMITAEHINFCHPVIFSVLSKLFNIMLDYSYVPRDFGKGLTIPIPEGENMRGIHTIESFRGITLSPIISKLFEHCILLLFSDCFVSSVSQFGFKSKLGCPHAIYTVRKVVDHYVNNNSTVNLCFLDMTKGFDKISHSILSLKLMQRKIPYNVIKLLQCWYDNSYNCVRWEHLLSNPYKLLSGVRQGGGVLSPILFSVCVDDMLVKF